MKKKRYLSENLQW